MNGVEKLRKFVLSLPVYLYVHSGKLTKICLMPKISIILKCCNVGKYTGGYFKTSLLEYLVFLGNKFRFICFINEKHNLI